MTGRRRASLISKPGDSSHGEKFTCVLCGQRDSGLRFVQLARRKICFSCARAIYVRLNREVELGGPSARKLDRVGGRRPWPEKRRELLAAALPADLTVEQYGLIRGVLSAILAQAKWKEHCLQDGAPAAEEAQESRRIPHGPALRRDG